MTREMRRFRQQLEQADCEEILMRNTSGVLALNGDEGWPYAVPLSYAWAAGKLIFHGAKAGHKLDAMRKEPRASFCVVDADKVVPERFTTYYRSVICFGRMRVVEEPEEMRRLTMLLGEKYWPGHPKESAEEIDGAMSRLCVFVMDVERVTGKQAIELTKEEP